MGDDFHSQGVVADVVGCLLTECHICIDIG